MGALPARPAAPREVRPQARAGEAASSAVKALGWLIPRFCVWLCGQTCARFPVVPSEAARGTHRGRPGQTSRAVSDSQGSGGGSASLAPQRATRSPPQRSWCLSRAECPACWPFESPRQRPGPRRGCRELPPSREQGAAGPLLTPCPARCPGQSKGGCLSAKARLSALIPARLRCCRYFCYPLYAEYIFLCLTNQKRVRGRCELSYRRPLEIRIR